ncbi:hypothetical protein ACWGDS_39955 [Streptomyces sp. NPDC055059]
MQRRTAPQVAGRDEHRTAERALLRPAFARQVAFTLALGVFFGAMQVSVTAYAVGRGTPDSAPLLYAVSNCTSLLAGWVYGLRAWRTPAGRQRALVAAGLAAASLPLTILDAPLPLSLALALTGFAVPPLLVLSSVLAESMVPRAALTQAFTWLNSASAAGSAGAAAVAGQAVDTAGAHGGFAVAAAATAGMAVLAAVGGREAAAQPEPAAPER